MAVENKDKVLFISEDEALKPLRDDMQALSVAKYEDDEVQGAIKPNGEINWACPCMGGLVSGPCGYEFRQSFSCFMKSESDDKGMECLEQFKAMSECMSKYPTLYGRDADDGGEAGEFDDLLDQSVPGESDDTTVSASKSDKTNGDSSEKEDSKQSKS